MKRQSHTLLDLLATLFYRKSHLIPVVEFITEFHTKMKTIEYLLLVVLFISVTLPQSTIASPMISYGFVALSYLILLVYIFITNSNLKFIAPKTISTLFLIVALLFLFQLAISPTLQEILRIPIFIIALLNIGFLPRMIEIEYFYASVSRVSALVVMVGLIPLLGGPQHIGGLDLTPWHGEFTIYNFNVHPPTSIFSNPNAFGIFALFGLISSIGEMVYRANPISYSISLICAFGLSLSHYRTAWLALFAATILYISWEFGGIRGFTLILLGGVLTSAVALGIIFNVIPGPNAISSLDLNGRVQIWTAAYFTFWERPFFGFGFSSAHSAIQPRLENTSQFGRGFHNSYIRMFVVSGVIGGFSYVGLIVSSVAYPLRRVTTRENILLVIFVTVGAIIQIFNGLTILGLSLSSMLLSIVTGYALQEVIDE